MECIPLAYNVRDELEVSSPAYYVTANVWQLVRRRSKTFSHEAAETG